MPEASGRVITAPTCADLARNLATLAQVKSKKLLKGRISPYIVPPLPVPSAAAISPDAEDRHHDRGTLVPSEMTGGGGGGDRGDTVGGGLRARSITEGVFCVYICGRLHGMDVCMYWSLPALWRAAAGVHVDVDIGVVFKHDCVRSVRVIVVLLCVCVYI